MKIDIATSNRPPDVLAPSAEEIETAVNELAANLECQVPGAAPPPGSSEESRRLVQCLNGAGRLTSWTIVSHEQLEDWSAEAFLPARGPLENLQPGQDMLPA